MEYITANLAERLSAMACFRNILAHGYVIIDPRIVYRSLKATEDLYQFISMAFKFI